MRLRTYLPYDVHNNSQLYQSIDESNLLAFYVHYFGCIVLKESCQYDIANLPARDHLGNENKWNNILGMYVIYGYPNYPVTPNTRKWRQVLCTYVVAASFRKSKDPLYVKGSGLLYSFPSLKIIVTEKVD